MLYPAELRAHIEKDSGPGRGPQDLKILTVSGAPVKCYIFFSRRALQLSWAVLLLITGLQLVSYKETDGAFAPRLVTFESAPDVPAVPVKNVKTTDKKRPGN